MELRPPHETEAAAGITCGDCLFAAPAILGEEGDEFPVLECRRFPPQVIPDIDEDGRLQAVQVIPQVSADGWCGEAVPVGS